MSERIEISGEIETPLLAEKSSSETNSIMASWSNISVPGNVGAALQQQVILQAFKSIYTPSKVSSL